MRKYGRWMLALGIMAVSPAMSQGQSFMNKTRARTAQPARSTNYNQQMAEQIAGALRGAKLRGYNVEIEFKDGVAVLMGQVNDPSHKQRATQAVQALRGVARVDNRLTVIGAPAVPVVQSNWEGRGQATRQVQQVSGQPQVSNQKVAESIASALGNAGLSGYDVEIRYQNGTATLGGSVATAQQKALAEKVASRVSGVHMVTNQLAVQAPVRRVAYQQTPPAPAGAAPAVGAPAANNVPMGNGVVAPPVQNGVPMNAAPVPGPVVGSPPPMMASAGPAPMVGNMGGNVYGTPNLPDYAWPSYAQYPNSAAITYPTQYSASAWPYIGPYYPYPQVPLGWRKAQLEWDDGHWQLRFNSKTDKWWWFLRPKNW